MSQQGAMEGYSEQDDGEGQAGVELREIHQPQLSISETIEEALEKA